MKSIWPAFFPYPISWIRTFWVSASLLFTLKVTFPGIHQVFGVYAIWAILCWLIQMPVIAIGRAVIEDVIDLVATKWPSWLPGHKELKARDRRRRLVICLKEGMNAVIVLMIGLVVIGFIFGLTYDPYSWSTYENIEAHVTKMRVVFVVVVAYLYQYDYVVRQGRARKKVARAERKVAQAEDSIETELRQMKKKMEVEAKKNRKSG